MAWNRRSLFALAGSVLVSCSTSSSLKTRLVNAERRAAEAEKLLDQAEHQLAALEADSAEGPLKRAQEALSDADLGYYPEREMLSQRLSADLKRLPEVRREREVRDRARLIDERRAEVEKAFAKLRPELITLKKRGLGNADVDRANDAAKSLQAALDDGRELETKDETYAAYAKGKRTFTGLARSEIELGKKRLEFAAGPASARKEAVELARRAKTERDRDKKIRLRAHGREKFAECAKAGERLLILYPALAGTITVGNEPLTARALVASCAKQARVPKTPAKLAQSSRRTRR
jgi:hypothetical protein